MSLFNNKKILMAATVVQALILLCNSSLLFMVFSGFNSSGLAQTTFLQHFFSFILGLFLVIFLAWPPIVISAAFLTLCCFILATTIHVRHKRRNIKSTRLQQTFLVITSINFSFIVLVILFFLSIFA